MGINPRVDLLIFCSDGPKASATRLCADDFGSALRALRTLRIHVSIFTFSVHVSGLHLERVRCIVIVSGCELTNELCQAIWGWLSINVPEFLNFSVAASGKYLGWVLGRNSSSFCLLPHGAVYGTCSGSC